MFTLNNAISPEDSFEVEKAVSFLVSNYNVSGYNPKPVILHSLRVANILMEMGYGKKIIIGAILHDILEDTAVTPDQIREKFGQAMLELIMAVSYNESIKDPVMQNKDMYSRALAYGRDAVVLKAVDIAVNSLYIDLVANTEKQKQLIEKGKYFSELTKEYINEPAWKLLNSRNFKNNESLS
jgi:(p)ppGpp synthase/HD superfamily hydrolase